MHIFKSFFFLTTNSHSIPGFIDPTTHIQAQKHSQWYLAMSNDFDAFIHNQT